MIELNKLKEFYEKKHEEDTDYFELYPIVTAHKFLRGQWIANLGSGRNTRNIEKNRTDVVFSDISLNAMRAAEKKRRTASFVVLDAQKLPFKNNSIGSILCKDLLEHLPDDKSCIKEMERSVKNGGRIYIYTPTQLKEEEIKKWGHLRAYPTVESLQNLFERSELIYREYYRSYGGRRILSPVLSFIVRFLSILPLNKLPAYLKLEQEFDITKRDFAWYIVDKLDKLLQIPKFKVALIAVFEKRQYHKLSE